MRRLSYLVIGWVVAALAAEAALRPLPVATEYGNLPVNAQNPVLRGSPHARYVYSKDWNFRFAQSGRLNGDGFISPESDQAGDCNALMIGNSYVEAGALAPERHLAALLDRRLPDCDVIALAKSGDSLADYLALAQWGVARHPTRAIMILLIDGDVRRAFEPHTGGHYFNGAGDSLHNQRVDWPGLAGIKQRLSQLSLFRYAWYNLNVPATLPAAWARVSQRLRPVPAATSGADDAVRIRQAGEFALGQLRGIAAGTPVLFVIDAPHEPGAQRDIDHFASLAAERRFAVLHLRQTFEDYRMRTGLRTDLRPLDWHWNEAAQSLAADAIMPRLRELLDSTRGASPHPH